MILKYLPNKVHRQYGIFVPQDPTHKGCPPQQYDAEVLLNRDIFDMDSVDLLNYHSVKNGTWFDENIIISIAFSRFGFEVQPEMVTITMTCTDLSDFIGELRTQFIAGHTDHV